MRNTFFLALFLVASMAYAEEPLAVYDLRLFGLQLGMTYDQAISATPFHYTYTTEQNEIVGIVTGRFHQTDFNISASFLGDRLFKIIGRFNPAELETIRGELKKCLGTGEDNSRSVTSGSNITSYHNLHKWIFPGARIDLISISSRTDVATLSIISTRAEQPEKSP